MRTVSSFLFPRPLIEVRLSDDHELSRYFLRSQRSFLTLGGMWLPLRESRQHLGRSQVYPSATKGGNREISRFYHLLMTNSFPWKIPMLLIGKPSISIRAIYTMATSIGNSPCPSSSTSHPSIPGCNDPHAIFIKDCQHLLII